MALREFIDAGGRFMWVATSRVSCRRPAGGCEARNGRTETLNTWTAEGLPRTGWSACDGNCLCVLLPMFSFTLDIAGGLDDAGERGHVTDGVGVDVLPEPDPRVVFPEGAPVLAEFLETLSGLELVGTTRDLIDDVLHRVRSGGLSVAEAIDLIDEILGAGAGVGGEPR